MFGKHPSLRYFVAVPVCQRFQKSTMQRGGAGWALGQEQVQGVHQDRRRQGG